MIEIRRQLPRTNYRNSSFPLWPLQQETAYSLCAPVGMMGESGRGKTTFFRLLTGIYPYESGTIRLFGRKLEEYTGRKEPAWKLTRRRI